MWVKILKWILKIAIKIATKYLDKNKDGKITPDEVIEYLDVQVRNLFDYEIDKFIK